MPSWLLHNFLCFDRSVCVVTPFVCLLFYAWFSLSISSFLSLNLSFCLSVVLSFFVCRSFSHSLFLSILLSWCAGKGGPGGRDLNCEKTDSTSPNTILSSHVTLLPTEACALCARGSASKLLWTAIVSCPVTALGSDLDFGLFEPLCLENCTACHCAATESSSATTPKLRKLSTILELFKDF